MPKSCLRHTCVLLIGLTVASMIYARSIGPTYPIVERDMLEEIERTLQQKEQSGELARLQQAAIEKSKASIERPKVLVDLPRVRQPRTFYYDPSFRVPETIRDHEGRVIAEAGTVVNPLDYVQMPAHLLFINGDDTGQVDLADRLYKHYQGQIKLVLVKGQPLEMTRRNGYPVYFDQGAVLIRKFNLAAVPALVSQEGKRLRIDELEVK